MKSSDKPALQKPSDFQIKLLAGILIFCVSVIVAVYVLVLAGIKLF